MSKNEVSAAVVYSSSFMFRNFSATCGERHPMCLKVERIMRRGKLTWKYDMKFAQVDSKSYLDLAAVHDDDLLERGVLAAETEQMGETRK